MKVRYLKSATVAIETQGVKILADPWLTDGEYYGSWYHYPKFEFDEAYFADFDYIYVSHIHPDHFSKATFRLLNKQIPVLIHEYDSKFLKLNIERMGFQVTELKHNQRTHLKNGVYINILAADNCNPELCAKFLGCALVETKFGSTQIDSLCVIDDGEYTVLNINDCPFDLAKDTLREVQKTYDKIDLLLVGYGGAGPYPQCFVMTEEERAVAAGKKKMQFLNQGLKFIQATNPAYIFPFAGTYTLGGKLVHRQHSRGVPDIAEAKEFFSAGLKDGQQVVLLNTYEYLDLATKATSKPYVPIDKQAQAAYAQNELAHLLLDYEKEEYPALDDVLALLPLAYNRFEQKRTEINFCSDTSILVKIQDDLHCHFRANGSGFQLITNEERSALTRFVSYEVDQRLLYNILRGPRIAHWNNAEIGSHITFERRPDIFERGLHHAMCYFHS